VERWRRIAHEAAQQARRSDVPIIHEPVPLERRIRLLGVRIGGLSPVDAESSRDADKPVP